MQTHFSLAQLADPDIAEADKILRACVHCGFCTATCPTYVLLGDELDSPRGRIYLIKDMLENDAPGGRRGGQAHRPLPLLPRLHDDLPLRRALHAPRRPGARAYRGDLRAPVARSPRAQRARDDAALSRTLPRDAGALMARRPRMRSARSSPGATGCTRRSRTAWCAALGWAGLFRRLGAMLKLSPATLPNRSPFEGPATSRPKARGAPASPSCCGCANEVLAPQINAAAIRLLTRNGVEVVVAEGEGCCGALVHHMGRERQAHAQAREQHRRLDARDRTRRPRRDPDHGVRLRHHREGLRLHVPQRRRLRREGGTRRGADQGYLRVSGDAGARRQRGVGGARARRRLSRRMLAAARSARSRRTEETAGGCGFHRTRAGGVASVLRFGRHLQHAAAGNLRALARSQSRQHRGARTATSSRPATSAACSRSDRRPTFRSCTRSSFSTGRTAVRFPTL